MYPEVIARRRHRYFSWHVIYEPGGRFATPWQVGKIGELAKVQHILHGGDEWRVGLRLMGRIPMMSSHRTRVDALWSLFTFVARN